MRCLSGHPEGDPIRSLPRLLWRLGFDAELQGLEVRLRSRPCPIVSPEQPEPICRLAGAAIDGIVETSPRALRMGASTHDPMRRICTIRPVAKPGGR